MSPNPRPPAGETDQDPADFLNAVRVLARSRWTYCFNCDGIHGHADHCGCDDEFRLDALAARYLRILGISDD